MRYLIDGCYGDANVGDEALLRATRELISSNDRNAEFCVLSDNPEETTRLHGVRSIQRHNPIGKSIYGAIVRGGLVGTLRAVAWCDALVLGGGELLRDDVGFRATAGMFLPLFIARTLGRKAIAIGVGAQRPISWRGRALLRAAVRSIDRIILRDQESVEVVTSLAESSEKLSWCSDIAITLPKRVLTPSAGGRGRRRIGVALKGVLPVMEMWQLVDRIGDGLLNSNAESPVSVLMMNFRAGDRELSVAAADKLKSRGLAVEVEDGLEIDHLVERLRELELTIAMPLHASVLSMACGVPSVGIAYDRKVTRLYDQWGLSEYCVDCSPASLADLEAVMGHAVRTGGETRQRIARVLEGRRTEINSTVRTAMDAILTPVPGATASVGPL